MNNISAQLRNWTETINATTDLEIAIQLLELYSLFLDEIVLEIGEWRTDEEVIGCNSKIQTCPRTELE